MSAGGRYRDPLLSSFDVAIVERRRAQCVAWTADGAFFISGLEDGRLSLSSPEKAVRQLIDAAKNSSVTHLAPSPQDPTFLAAALTEFRPPHAATLRQFDLRQGATHTTIAQGKLASEPLALAWHPNGRELAVSRKDRTVSVYDVRKAGSKLKPLVETTVEWDANGLTYAAEGDVLLAAYGRGEEGGVKVLKGSTLAEVAHHRSHHRPCECLALSPQESFIATGGHDAIVSIWDSDTMSVIHALYSSDDPIRRVSFSSDKRFLAYNGTNTFEGNMHSTIDVAILRPDDPYAACPVHRMTREELCGNNDLRWIKVMDFAWSPTHHVIGLACTGPRIVQHGGYGRSAPTTAPPDDDMIVFKRIGTNVSLT